MRNGGKQQKITKLNLFKNKINEWNELKNEVKVLAFFLNTAVYS